MWAALYQQRPAPEEGDYFKAAWLKPYVTAPAVETLAIYGASDYAVTADGGDFTVHVVVGVDPEGRMYLLDLWRKQASSDEWVEAFCALVRQWKPREWAEEKDRSKPAWDLSLSACNASDRHLSIVASFRRAETNRSEPSRSAAGWRSKDFTFLRMQVGCRRCDPNCCRSLLASTTTLW